MHRFFLSAVFAGVLGGSLARADTQDTQDDCVQVDDIALKITACTAAIESGTWSGANLAWAFSNCGLGFRRSGNLKRALQDYNEAIRLRPDYPDAYGNRAFLLDLMGKHPEAIADWKTALRQGGKERVKRAQTYLRDKGFYNGAIDGAYGPISQKALRACIYAENC
ncbi:MAG: tetratricopeptide repeat protein [Pseudomonadota bacterium]